MAGQNINLENITEELAWIRNAYNTLWQQKSSVIALVTVLREQLQTALATEKFATSEVKLLRQQLINANKVIQNLSTIKDEWQSLSKTCTSQAEEIERLKAEEQRLKQDFLDYETNTNKQLHYLEERLKTKNNETEDMMEGIRSGYLMQISDLTEQLNNYENASEKERNSVIQYYENKLSGLSEKFTRVNTDNQMAHQEIDIIKSEKNLLQQKLKLAENNSNKASYQKGATKTEITFKPGKVSKPTAKPALKRNYTKQLENFDLIPKSLIGSKKPISRISPLQSSTFNDGQILNKSEPHPYLEDMKKVSLGGFRPRQSKSDFENSTIVRPFEANVTQDFIINFGDPIGRLKEPLVNDGQEYERDQEIHVEMVKPPKRKTRKLFNLTLNDTIDLN